MKRCRTRILIALLLAATCCTPAGTPRQTGSARPAGWFGPGPVPPPQRMRMWFGGDVMQHLPQIEAARSGEGFDYGPVFAALAPRMRAADLAVVNLETTLTRRERYTGYPLFRSPVALADALREAGVDVAVMANNHCCDGGAEGIRTSIEELDRCGIRHTGVFADSLDYRRNHPLYLTWCGLRLALVNYTYGTNGMPVPEGMIVNRIDTVRMAADLAAARSEGADFIVACLHWGNEYERRANAAQRSLAAFLRRHGVDVVVGSHPHVVQPWEADSAHVVLYSLGNLVSNQRRCRATASCRPKRPIRWRCRRPTAYSGPMSRRWPGAVTRRIGKPNSGIKTTDRKILVICAGKVYLCSQKRKTNTLKH